MKCLHAATSGADGLVTFEDVVEGNYTLSETVAPEGYIKSEETYRFSVDAQGNVRFFGFEGSNGEAYENGKLVIENEKSVPEQSGNGGTETDVTPTQPDSSETETAVTPAQPAGGEAATTVTPPTGDTSMVGIWIILLLVSFASVCGIIIYKKRIKER